jgi:hypothetical protein
MKSYTYRIRKATYKSQTDVEFENFQVCIEPGSAGAAIPIGGFLAQIPRRESHKTLQT